MSKINKYIKKVIFTFKSEKKIPIPHQVNTTQLLDGKVALIVGGSGGIGMAIAESFLKNGARVVIAGTSKEKLNNCNKILGEGLPEYTSKVKSVVVNLLNTDALPDCIKEAASLFEENQIDILVNSSGILNHTDFWNLQEDEYDSIMNINVKGVFFMCQAMGKYMIENNVHGHILNVSSASSLRPAWTPYQISKWCIRGFTEGLADLLLPYGITVNAIAPGPVATRMLGVLDDANLDNQTALNGRYSEPEEIANLATFLVSDFADLIVGDTVYISGGSGLLSKHR